MLLERMGICVLEPPGQECEMRASQVYLLIVKHNIYPFDLVHYSATLY